MTDKPEIGELSRGAKEFVHDNQAYLIDFARPLVAFMLIAEAMQRIGPSVSKGFELPAVLITSYFSACFVLAWHRTSLLGARREYKVNPFRLKTGEGWFIITFFLLALVTVAFVVIGLVPGIALAAMTHSVGLSVLVSFAAVIAAIVFAMRFMFMLPARSVNASLSWGEAWHISQGLIWRLFAATFRANFLLILLVIAIAIVAGIAVFSLHFYVMDEQNRFTLTLPGSIVMFLILGIPVVLINFVALARGVTVLSRLYQWSVQNRPQGQNA
jgi:hypothetical protein